MNLKYCFISHIAQGHFIKMSYILILKYQKIGREMFVSVRMLRKQIKTNEEEL